MLQKNVDPGRPLPWQMFGQKLPRQTVQVVLCHMSGVVMVGPKKDSRHCTFIHPQGGICEGETVFEAARREVREEIPSLARQNRRDPFRVAWGNGIYLGSALNPTPRSGVPKAVHVVVFPVVLPRLTVNPNECWTGFWVYEPGTLAQLLEPTRQENPIKYQLIGAAIRGALERGILSS